MNDIKTTAMVDSTVVQVLVERNQYLERELKFEKKRRRELEDEVAELQKKIKPKRKRKEYTDEEMIAAASDYKRNGVKKSQKAESIRSYDDFVHIREMYGDNTNKKIALRTQMLWTMGVATGLRISDVTRLRYCHFYEEDFTTMRKRLKTVEKKTAKINEVFISEIMRICVEKLKEANNPMSINDYLFVNIHGDRLQEKAAYKDIAYPC